MAEFTEYTGEILDRLGLIEIRSPSYIKIPTVDLYEACREVVGQPLSYVAAKGIWERVEPGDVVLISGGFVVPPWLPTSETDGVPSSLGLGRAIQKACGARVVYATEANVAPVFRAGALAIGMGVVPLDILAETPEIGRVAGRVAVVPFPIDPVEASVEADRLIEQLAPKALVTIERSGPAEDGICYTGIGGDMTDSTSKIHLLVERAADAGTFTVGCFDLGNEIGGRQDFRNSEACMEAWSEGSLRD